MPHKQYTFYSAIIIITIITINLLSLRSTFLPKSNSTSIDCTRPWWTITHHTHEFLFATRYLFDQIIFFQHLYLISIFVFALFSTSFHPLAVRRWPNFQLCRRIHRNKINNNQFHYMKLNWWLIAIPIYPCVQNMYKNETYSKPILFVIGPNVPRNATDKSKKEKKNILSVLHTTNRHNG